MGSRSFAAGLAILALSAAGGARAQYADNLSRGKAAAPVSDLKITISPNSDLSSEYFGYFDLTLENKSDEWIMIRRTTLSFPDTFYRERIRIVSGAEYAVWRETMTRIIATSEANQQATLAAIGAVGAGLAVFGGNNALRTAGDAMAFGSIVGYGASELGKRADSLKRADAFPESHLLRDSILIPPGLFVKKWLLLNSKGHKAAKKPVQEFTLECSLVTPRGDSLHSIPIAVRYPETARPKWQRSLYDRY